MRNIALLFFTAVAILPGQATRTWISGVGDDANPCSRTAPCKTFAGAISKTAAGGEIDVLDPGGFGAVTITKSITLNGKGVVGSILVAATNGISINAASTDIIILRDIMIKGPLTLPALSGVRVFSAKRVEIYDSVIEGASVDGVTFSPSNPNSELLLSNVRISSIAGDSVHIEPTNTGTGATAILDNTTLIGATNGVFVGGGAKAIVRNSSIMTMSGNGVMADSTNGASQAFVEKSTILGTGNGIQSGPGTSVVRISDNFITGSTRGLFSFSPGVILSFNNNKVSGNTTEGAATATVAQK